MVDRGRILPKTSSPLQQLLEDRGADQGSPGLLSQEYEGRKSQASTCGTPDLFLLIVLIRQAVALTIPESETCLALDEEPPTCTKEEWLFCALLKKKPCNGLTKQSKTKLQNVYLSSMAHQTVAWLPTELSCHCNKNPLA